MDGKLNTPGIIRWPFEQIASKCLSFNTDIIEILTEIKNCTLNF